MKNQRPKEHDYASHVSYSRALEDYCDALERQQQEPVALPDGKRLILVDGTFDELVYWLDRCEDKGHLDNCYDLVGPWANFKYEDYASPPPAR